MARTTAPPAFTMTLKELMETQPRYGMELYKDGYFVVVHGVEEHYKRLKKGWSEEPEEGVIYKPESASEEAIEAARKQVQRLAELKTKKVETETLVNMDQVRQMIDEAVAAARA